MPQTFPIAMSLVSRISPFPRAHQGFICSLLRTAVCDHTWWPMGGAQTPGTPDGSSAFRMNRTRMRRRLERSERRTCISANMVNPFVSRGWTAAIATPHREPSSYTAHGMSATKLRRITEFSGAAKAVSRWPHQASRTFCQASDQVASSMPARHSRLGYLPTFHSHCYFFKVPGCSLQSSPGQA
jgi:hypothetical protein